jgi:hypothetical protein
MEPPRLGSLGAALGQWYESRGVVWSRENLCLQLAMTDRQFFKRKAR